ncbi:hypothetical protein D3C86_1230430 [compost metagenome]
MSICTVPLTGWPSGVKNDPGATVTLAPSPPAKVPPDWKPGAEMAVPTGSSVAAMRASRVAVTGTTCST